MKIKKTVFGIVFFLSTFLVGYVSVLLIRETTTSEKTAVIHLQTEHIFSEELSKPAPKIEESFEPKIFDLTDFEDLEESDYKYKTKLIDISVSSNNFRKEDIEARSGETWLGLFQEKGKYFLRYTKIEIRPERRPDWKRDDSVTIKTDKKTDPFFLLKHAENLREGEIKTLYRRISYEESEGLGIDSEPMGRGYVKKFQFGGVKYTFRVKEGLTKSKKKILALILETEETSQIVDYISYYESGDYVGNLLWVGDLDRDGKLDFYMDEYTYEKGGFGSGLYLSSEAEKGKLVKDVAGFGLPGC